ncbi:putative ribonuclease H-like domain-containing protein [Tanacetum coccineum]|uniref:Ribonuclease H-like domain-containing protein n=1 Tax=Tanacetum coccineum TaxID=301880 RepID=A0ABQ4Y078_9ASTR
MVPTTVLMKSGLVSINTARQNISKTAVSVNTARQVNAAHTKTTVNAARPMSHFSKTTHSIVKRPIHKNTSFKNSNFNQRVNTVKDKNVNAVRPKAVVNAARPKAAVNVVKGYNVNVVKASACWVWKPKTNVLDHVSKHNSASITLKEGNPQMDLQDKGVIDSGCSMSHPPKAETRGLKFNLFSVSQMCDKKNSVLFNDTECIVLSPNFKSIDESQVLLRVPRKNNMYSVDLKNIVPKGGLTCLFAKATSNESKFWHRRLGHLNFKTMNKLVKGNLVRDLPSKLFENDETCVACQKGKQHRASSTKNETGGILKSFIIGIENLVDYKVKVIRCDNGTKFKNRIMNQFCEMKGILRQYCVARTPQQNEVAERRNRTLIKAARTMLPDSKLPTIFWAKAVNNVCYVQNRVLVVKPYSKTPYKLFHGRTPTLSFMRPFSKAFRVFNSRTRIVEENLHIRFSESIANVVGTKASDNAGQARKETKPVRIHFAYIMVADPTIFSRFKEFHDDGSKPSSDDEKKIDEDPRKESECNDQEKDDNVNSTNNVNVVGTNKVNAVGENISIELPFDPKMPALEDDSIFDFSSDDVEDGAMADMNNLDTTIQVSPIPTTRIHKDHPLDQVIGDLQSATLTRKMLQNLEEHGFEEPKVDLPNGKKEFVGSNGLFRIKKDEKGNLKIEEEVYVCQPPGFEDPDFPDRVYKVEKALYGLHQAPRAWYETLSTYLLDNGFQRGKIDKTLFIKRYKDEVYRRTFSLLRFTMMQKKDGIFISQDKYIEEILKKFGFTKVKTASTPMETQKPLLKDEDGEEVDVHMYRSMIGSLMYLTSSRLDIMFAVCACARYQVNPKVSHLHAVKRIFRYLKGQPKLGLWYPKDSPFDLVAYTDSDYARASLDRKSTTGGCQFLGCRLISWQCKKQTVVANSTTEAEYVAASSCCGQVKQRKVFKLMMEKLCDGIEVNAFNPKLKPRYDQDSAKWCCIQSSMLKHVIENGATLPKTTTVEGVVTVMPITTAEEKAQRRLEVKARSTLMMGAFQLNIYANGHVDYGVRRLLKTYRKDVTVNGLRLLVLIVLTEVLHLPQEGNFARSVELKKSRQTRTRIAQKEAEEGPNYALMAFSYDSEGNPQMDLQDQGVIDSGCSRHMTGNMSYLTDYEEIDGGYVAFGGNPKGGKITGKGTIKTGNLDFENVYFVRELKFNLFSVSQMCDKKNSVLFNDTECIVLSPNFKLIDESQVLLRVPRKNNMYSVDLKNIVPKGGLTCLFAKATSDESKLWHRRLGHLNFKTMNKLVKGNLGKQHKASCKSKIENSISLPLHLLHMDLFGPTFVKSLKKKMYYLVVTDDYSRFTWVFFLATKDETSGILKSFITGIENLVDHKVKVIRCDNGTEFKNREMNQFCEMKGILRQFSVARTP